MSFIDAQNVNSVCPICLTPVPARRVRKDDGIYLQKECPRCGEFSTMIWRNKVDFDDWLSRSAHEPREQSQEDCPLSCFSGGGLCSAHLRDTCCVLIEVTGRCNLNCNFCFAARNRKSASEPTLEHLKSCFEKVATGDTLVQLSGGEPTMRDDLPLVVRAAKDAGCRYVQLNSNGIRLAEDKNYLKELADAGLSFVFMQFDGTDDDVYRSLRGRALFDIKKRAIENCAELNIGVTLVPTLVPNLNISQIGDILRFGVKNSPAVRGVHFQPVSYFGTPDAALPTNDERFTLDELIWQISQQAGDIIDVSKSIAPSCCDHPLCGFHGDFAVLDDGTLYSLSPRERSDAAAAGATRCCCSSSHATRAASFRNGMASSAAEKNRHFVARRWERTRGGSAPAGKKRDMSDMDNFIERVKSHGFTVTAMAFQDAGNLDSERLQSCSLHVFDGDVLRPFCANYITPFRAN